MTKNLKFFTLIVFFCLFSDRLPAQQIESPPPALNPAKTISMDFQDANLKDVLKIFSIQSGMNFVASEAVADRRITLFLDNVLVKEAMDKIFKANNLTYELDKDSNIFLVKDWGKPELETVTKVYYIKHRVVPGANLEVEKGILLSPQTSSTLGSSGSSSQGGLGSSYGSTSGSSAGGSSSSGSGSSTLTASSGRTDMLTVIKQILGKEGKITADINTNSLIITDVPSRFPEIERTIAFLDVPQPQVMLDVEILNVSKNVVDRLGFEFGNNPLTLILPGSFNKGKLFMGSVARMGATTVDSASAGSLVFGSTYAQLLDFLRTQTDTQYLARPRLLTLNNETAEISITKDEVVGFEQETTVTSGVQSTSKTFIRSTDLKLTPEGVGIFLRVTPQINPDTGEITMVLNPKSSVTSTSTLDSSQADAEVRTTKSIVRVKDGDTVILGGIINKDKTVINKKVPFFGDIPILGALFRHKNQEKNLDRELIVFITPHIVKEGSKEFTKLDKFLFPEAKGISAPDHSRRTMINEYLDEFEKKGK